jgi:hypothetical protein
MTPYHQSQKYRVLFEGERKARKSHECQTCHRPIKKGEYYWTKVIVIGDSSLKKQGYIQQEKYCCKARK